LIDIVVGASARETRARVLLTLLGRETIAATQAAPVQLVAAE